VSDPFRTERAEEIRRLLARQSALLDDLAEGQREFGRRLGRSTAELNGRIEHLTQLADKA
jgi:hypothetical protein